MHPLPSPYPTIYCPVGIARPACCAHVAPAGLLAGKGPDVAAQAGPGGGMWYGGAYRDEGPWQRTHAGWYVALDGHRPQDLARVRMHPRIARARNVAGATSGHVWQVPVILTPVEEGGGVRYVSALDRVWNGTEWQIPDELQQLQEPLLAILGGVPLHLDPVERNDAVRRLALGLLAQGSWVDEPLLAVTGWLSELVMVNVVRAGFDADPVQRLDDDAALDGAAP